MLNPDEINEETGFKRAEEHVWDAFQSSYLNATAEHRAAEDVNSWVDAFCEQAKKDGVPLDRNLVQSVCVLGMYTGARDEFQQRTGRGKAIYANGDEYEGEFYEGKKHGNGRYQFTSLGISAVDRLVTTELARVRGASSGTLGDRVVEEVAARLQLSRHVVAGVVEYGPYAMYVGEYERGERSGKGIMKNKDASLYKGEQRKNKRDGQGVLYYLNGDVFSGHWEKGRKHGFGTYHFARGGEYRGEWVRGTFTQGQWIRCNGVYYEGKFDKKNRPRDSCATMHYPEHRMMQKGRFQRGVWTPTCALTVCDEAVMCDRA